MSLWWLCRSIEPSRRLQQNLRLRQQPRLENLRLHVQSQAKRQKKTKLRANVKGWVVL
jgi:multidrug resistance efflux pump